jgi:TonB family protein
MRRIIWCILALFVCGFTSATLAQKSPSPEADEMESKVMNLYRGGQIKEALAAAKRTVELRAASHEVDAAAVRSLYNLATIYRQVLEFDAALKTFQKALEMNEVVAPGSRSTATILEMIGGLHHLKHDDQAAIDSYKKALSISEQASAQQPVDTIGLVLRLGLLYTATGERAEADRLLDRFNGYKPRLSEEQRQQFDVELQEFACELRSAGNASDADRIESQMSTVTVPGNSNDKQSVNQPGEINGRATYLGVPPYPAVARSAGASGKVKVRVIIDESGTPVFACILSGHPLLHAAAKNAALESRFTPTLRNGKAVRVAGTITFNFVAQ